jgi:hypothetical protein
MQRRCNNELRDQHPFLPAIPQQQDSNEIMRACMNLKVDGQQRRALANYLNKHMTIRRRVLADVIRLPQECNK